MRSASASEEDRWIMGRHRGSDAPSLTSSDALLKGNFESPSEAWSSRTVMSAVSESLSQLEVLVVDVQATAAAPHGHLLEMGWARAGARTTAAHVRLIALPPGERIPPAVARLTGISERMAQGGVDAHVAWRELSNEAATLARQPAPTVIHFARFEQPFLRALAHGAPPLEVVC